ncbi:hypothetical protein HBB16_10635 [Pseudonocardia sp. MCCB 268]|nr:hypothetical protein [Pseudonocardia cytotoxica]
MRGSPPAPGRRVLAGIVEYGRDVSATPPSCFDPEGRVATTSSSIHYSATPPARSSCRQPAGRHGSPSTRRRRSAVSARPPSLRPAILGLWNELVGRRCRAGRRPRRLACSSGWRTGACSPPPGPPRHPDLVTLPTAAVPRTASYCGHSRVVDPVGEVVAEAGADEEVLIVDIDPVRWAGPAPSSRYSPTG